ncbi:MAG: RpiB/LacA/LacB family sugar-phosphate isomerase, partial [Candidatus Binatia bacterium]
MKIAIASDHAGYKYKNSIIKHLQSKGHAVLDLGTNSEDPVDYPDYIRPAAQSVAE